MSEVTRYQQFSHQDFGTVRSFMKDGQPWFVAADVCKALEIGNSRQAVFRLEADEKGVISTDTPGGAQTMTIVSEPGLYALVLGSRKPEAKAFRRWITHDVIPAIRKTGGYVADSDAFIQNYLPFADESTKQLFRATLDVIDQQNRRIQQDAPRSSLPIAFPLPMMTSPSPKWQRFFPSMAWSLAATAFSSSSARTGFL